MLSIVHLLSIVRPNWCIEMIRLSVQCELVVPYKFTRNITNEFSAISALYDTFPERKTSEEEQIGAVMGCKGIRQWL
jgi:hypothetical protein